MKIWIFILISSLFIVACSSVQPDLSSAQKKIIAHNQDGNKAFYANDYQEALTQYNEALKIALSVENFESIAISKINIAMVYRKMTDRAMAHKYVDSIISDSGLYNKSSIYSATLLKMMLLMDDNDFAQANSMAETAISLCKETKCKSAGTVYNVIARIAIKNKDCKSAKKAANLGLELNKKYGDKNETANSYRLLGDGALLDSDNLGAAQSYNQALIIDKAQGISEKVFMDLMGIGNSYFNQGEYKDALIYFKRAHSVSVNGNLSKELIDAVSLMIDNTLAHFKQ